jgi:hypothetical protein
VATTLLFLAVGFFAGALRKTDDKQSWNPEEVYALWIEGVEVSSHWPDGRPWNRDRTAPNLFATLSWRDTVILETPEAPKTLIARWDRTAIKVKNLLKTELSPHAMENVARIHAGAEESIVVDVRDRGLLKSRLMGSVHIPCGRLRLGLNIINFEDPELMIRSLLIRVASSAILERNGPIPDVRNLLSSGSVVAVPAPVQEVGASEGIDTITRGLKEGIQKGLREGFKAFTE